MAVSQVEGVFFFKFHLFPSQHFVSMHYLYLPLNCIYKNQTNQVKANSIVSGCYSPLGYEYHTRPSPQQGTDERESDEDAMPRSIELIMEKIQRERRSLIDESCRKIQWRRQSRPARFYVDDSHQLMYCYIPKVVLRLTFLYFFF